MSKPMGAIPAGYLPGKNGELHIGDRSAADLVAEAGDTPLFVYDLDRVAERIASFRAAFAGIDLHYAIKANPYSLLLNFISNNVDGLDVASEGELELALAADMAPERISFAGPGKRDNELLAAIRTGVVINCESEQEAERALGISRAEALPAKLAVRVNPDFEIKGSGMRMGGGAKPFGVDAARVPALVRYIVDHGGDWRGFHIFAGSQALSPASLIEAQAATLDLVIALAEEIGKVPPQVNLGGGFGIPYFHGEAPLDIEAVGQALRRKLKNLPQQFAEARFSIELGRWLVGEAGVYLTRILDRKESHGKLFLITDGGMHHQLAASGNFGQVVRRNYPVAIANRLAQPPVEEASIVGCLCTPLDRLADDVMVPRAEIGDIVAVFMAGAYGLSASPQSFLSQQPALEMVVGRGT